MFAWSAAPKVEILLRNLTPHTPSLLIQATHTPVFHTAQVRGRGLLNAIVIKEEPGATAWEMCMRLKEEGLLAKPTHGNIIRLAPPLVMTEEQLLESVAIIKRVFRSFD